ncbi:MAG TPA: nucleotidyl transferase AbiEii/AbiGii toxin family protein [Vicingaceae bacterium]
MSSTYKNLKHYAFSEHATAFKVLTEVFREFSIHYFLIGAQARDVHFYQQGIKPNRGTRDIDFAVMMQDMAGYNELKEALNQKGFENTKDPFRLNWSQGDTVIDLLPFGQIEEDYTVNFDERDLELSVLGYSELNEELQEFYLDEDESVSIPVPPLHGIFLLKLLSWDDTKPDRNKDLKDLNQILNNYWAFVENEAYEKHLDLFDDDFTMDMAAARILGRHLKATILKSPTLQTNIIRILEEQTNQIDPPGLMLQSFAGENDTSIEEVKILLDEILKGIKDEQ